MAHFWSAALARERKKRGNWRKGHKSLRPKAHVFLSVVFLSHFVIATLRSSEARATYDIAPDGVSGGELGERDVTGGLVGDEGVLGRLLPLVGGGELCEIAVVVPLHLVVENLGLSGVGAGNEVFVEHVEDVVADVIQLLLDLG